MVRFLRSSAFAAATLLALSGAHAAPTETIIFNFHLRDGIGRPTGPLVMGPDGSLYGTTNTGGGSTACYYGCGTIYKLTPPKGSATVWTGTILYAVSALYDYFDGPLVLGADGSLYGTREVDYDANDTGSVFKLTPPTGGRTGWTYETLHRFAGRPDGNQPVSDVIDASGVLYGITGLGGSGNAGSLFKLTPPAPGQTVWTETIVHSFGGQFLYPEAPLRQTTTGELYGVAHNSLHSVNFYLIKTTVGSIPRILFGFDKVDGKYAPNRPFIIDSGGAIFGAATVAGRDDCDTQKPMTCGAVFEISSNAPRAISYLHIFSNPLGGKSPDGGVIAGPNGSLYGTTFLGGAGADQGDGHGIVYSLTPPASGGTAWTKKFLHAFQGTPDGAMPYFGLTKDAAGALYGVTLSGGSFNQGAAFKIVP